MFSLFRQEIVNVPGAEASMHGKGCPDESIYHQYISDGQHNHLYICPTPLRSGRKRLYYTVVGFAR